jgi:hypothetical protein
MIMKVDPAKPTERAIFLPQCSNCGIPNVENGTEAAPIDVGAHGGSCAA